MSGQLAGLVIATDPSGFIRATVPSGSSFQWMLAAVENLKEAVEHGACSRALVDLSCVRPPGLVEQAILGEHLARALSRCEKIASVVAHGTRTGTSEQVAQRLNLALRVFTNEPDAIAWLTN